MSNVEEGDTERQQGDTGIQLTQAQREFFQAGLANPADFPPGLIGWLEDFVLSRQHASNIAGLASRIWAPGDPKWVIEDLTANSSEYVYQDSVGAWLYLNGTTVSRTTYDLIFAKYGTTFNTGGEAGSDFRLPDTRGRSIWTCGTNAALDLGDNDGVAEASRQPKHAHTLTGGPGRGTLAVDGAPGGTFGNSTHVHSSLLQSQEVQTGTGQLVAKFLNTNSAGPQGTASPTLGTLAVTGAPSIGTTAVGSGMSGSDAVAHIALGSAFVKV